MKTMPKFADLNKSEKAKVVSESWGKLNDEQKNQYITLATNEKKEFEKG